MSISTIINSPDALYALMTTTSEADLGKSYIQTANIDMSAYTSKSIAGTETSTPYDFTGVFDGGGYTITIGEVSDWTGLFDSVATPGVVKNVNLIYQNALTLTVSGTNFKNIWGGLVGGLVVASISNCSVTFNNTISVSASVSGIPIGLLCGFMGQNSIISNSSIIINNSVSLIGNDNSSVGLLCGLATDSTITNCSVSSSSSEYDISLTVVDSSTVSDNYSSIGLLCGYFGTNFTSLNQPLLTNNTVNLNNNGTLQLANTALSPGTTYIGAICGTLDGDSQGGSTDATNCIVNVNFSQALVEDLTDFGQLVDNTSVQNCIFTWTTTTDNNLIHITNPSVKPSPAVSVKYINSITNNYELSSGNYYIPNTSGSLIIGPQTISLQSLETGIGINGTLYPVNTSYSSANFAYLYTIYVKGVGSMYFGLDIQQAPHIVDSSIECLCQINSCSTNPQTGITADSRITNTKEDKTIRVNVDREFATNSIVYPKFKSYSDYMKYLQGALKY